MTIKQLSWNDEQYCFYTNKHVDKAEFLEAAIPVIRQEVGDPIVPDDMPGIDDIEHSYFKPMAPHEARARGWEWGVNTAQEGEGGAYPITKVLV